MSSGDSNLWCYIGWFRRFLFPWDWPSAWWFGNSDLKLFEARNEASEENENRNESKQKQIQKRTNLRVLTWNTRLLLGYGTRTRARKIAQCILEKQSEIDLICLEEVFAEGSRKELVRLLSPIFPHGVSRAGYCAYFGLGENSGLFIAAKSHVEWKDVVFVPYDAGYGVESMSRKGYLHLAGLRLIGSKVETNLLVTHTQSGTCAKGQAARLEQFREIKAKIGFHSISTIPQPNTNTNTHPHPPSVPLPISVTRENWMVLGDLNALDNSAELQILYEMGFQDSRRNDPEATHDTEGRIDYCLYKFVSGCIHAQTKAQYYEMDHLSDHRALIQSFSFGHW